MFKKKKNTTNPAALRELDVFTLQVSPGLSPLSHSVFSDVPPPRTHARTHAPSDVSVGGSAGKRPRAVARRGSLQLKRALEPAVENSLSRCGPSARPRCSFPWKRDHRRNAGELISYVNVVLLLCHLIYLFICCLSLFCTRDFFSCPLRGSVARQFDV